MSYTTHGFVSGMKLTGADMAEMDAQIAANETAIAAVGARVDAVPGQRTTALRSLSLGVDGDAIYLYMGDELLSSVSLPDLSDLVPCTGLTATGTLDGLMVGGTAQITATKQPNDCNQTIRYQSSDVSVATVSSLGVVTAVGSGTATITVSCGTYSQTLTAKVSRIVSLAGNMDDCAWLSATKYGDIDVAKFNCDKSNDFIGNIPFDFDEFKIKNGEKVTLTIRQTGWTIRQGIVVAAVSGQTPGVNDLREESAVCYLVTNVESVDALSNAAASYTYTNSTGADCWIVFTTNHPNSTLEQALTDIDTKISLVIGPA